MEVTGATWAAVVSSALSVLVQQFLSAPKKVPDWVAGLAFIAIGGVGFGLYALWTPLTSPVNMWIITGIMWVCGPAGFASLLAKFRVASKTNSL